MAEDLFSSRGGSSQSDVLCRGLVIGCSMFDDAKLPTMPTVVGELEAVTKLFAPDHVRLLVNPTLEEAQAALDRFLLGGRQGLGDDEALSVVFLSSHSAPVAGRTALLMRDSDAADPHSWLWFGRDLTEAEDPDLLPLPVPTPVGTPVLFILDGPFNALDLDFMVRQTDVAALISGGAYFESSSDGKGNGFFSRIARVITTGQSSVAVDGAVALEELRTQVNNLATSPQEPRAALYAPPRWPFLLKTGVPLRTQPFFTDTSTDLPPAPSASSLPPSRQDRGGEPTTQPAPTATPSPVSAPGDSTVEDSTPSPWPLDWDGVLLMRWAEAVRQVDPHTGGRESGIPLDVINGALAGALATRTLSPDSNDPVAWALLHTLETAQRPLEVVLEDAVGRLGQALPADPPEPTPDDLRRHAPTLTRAATIAAATSGGEPPVATIGQRHLLAAALTTTELPAELVAALGCDRVELAARLLTVVTDGADEALVHAWTAILAPDDLTSTFTSDYVPVFRRGPKNRRPKDLVDRLDVDVYVTMLAAMIARTSTAMPVSIGLFGEWGSGKSHFMELLRQKVEALSGAAAAQRDSTAEDASGGGNPYYGDIVQITFNAWNYSDTNLWASLAAEFFSQLGAPDVDPDEVRRIEIRKTLKTTNEVRRELQSVRDSAEDRATQIRAEYAAKSAERERRARSLNAGVVRAVLADEAVGTRLDTLIKQLGLKGDQDRALQLAQDVNEIRDDLSATRHVLAQRSLRWPFWLLLAVIGTLSAAALLPWDWSGALNTGAAAGIVTFLATVGTIVTRSRAAVGELRVIADAAIRARDRIAAGGNEDIDQLAVDLHTAEAEEALAQAQLREIDATIAQLNRQLLEYEPGRRLYEFIADRAASVDYRSQLGVVSMVRHDFEQLVNLMKEWREKAATADKSTGAPPPLRPMDRIVLYIDDLDRCEPEQVVQVLQAVHLLLAMDLFVVVVGVDPRWLLQALRTRYADILSPDAAGFTDVDKDLAGFAEATPQNYLEKIFQVPFVLPGMTHEGFDKLVRSFAPKAESGTGTRDRSDSAQRESTVDARAQDPSDDLRAEHGEAAPPLDVTTPTRPELSLHVTPQLAVDQTSDIAGGLAGAGQEVLTAISATPISKRELDLLSRLGGLVRTPRSATRLFNLYGLLRSARDLRRGRPFLGDRGQPGDYEAVITLLGVLIGAPDLLGLMLWGRPGEDDAARGLCRTHGPGDWYDFVDSLEPEKADDGGWINAVSSTIDADEAADWRDLVSHLRALRTATRLRDIERYRAWGPQVARFSFVLSRFATTGDDDVPSRGGTPPGPNPPDTQPLGAAGESRHP